ncbi:MAG: hypothetical protein ACTIII_06905 [Brachybacterium alimentarium]
MDISGAASLSGLEVRHDQGELPGLEELRVALRPPALPLPYPREVIEAARRAGDLLHAERYRDARRLVDAFRARPAPSADRLALLHAGLRGALRVADPEQVERDVGDMVALLTDDGYRELASALVTVLHERRALPGGASAVPRGRRRGRPTEPPAELLAVVRGLDDHAVAGEAGTRDGDVDPRRLVAGLRTALAALPAVRDQLPVDPEKALRVSLAQALELQGDRAGAITEALDVLERIEQEEIALEDAVQDPRRTAAAAHAVLARALGVDHPVQGARHALDALAALHEVDDPPLRVGLISHLLRALMAAGAITQASFTAGRLASLQRTLQRDALRTAPLLAIAAQRVQAERYEAAWVPLEQARRIACDQRDHRSSLEASRLAASIHERTGDHDRALHELRRLASEARWLADDLATERAHRAELVSMELNAQALVMRRALDLGRTELVEEAGEGIEHRARPEGGRPLLPPELLWDHRVDAQVARFIAAGEALNRGEEGATTALYERRRRAAMQVIDGVPTGHDHRARYWAAYVDDRHAQMLADRGRVLPALRAARRARAGWDHLARPDDVARVDLLIAHLEQD